jgi:serine/threonine-protein kinase
MGRVYLARQIDLGRQVVVKVMHDHITNDPNFRKRFERETLLMARFQHPYVVTLYDASLNDPEGPCIVMEYIRGITLDTVLQRNSRLGAPRVARLLGQLCEALFAAHQEGIIHRDLKPANLMVVDADSPYEKIKVMDFGLAKLADSPNRAMAPRADVTNNDFAVGTPGYISPEQVRGSDMDHRSDLYSLGVVLFELLTGRLPFTGAETMDVLLAHATQPPPSFEEIGASVWVPPAIEEVVRRCLAKDPADRPNSARDLSEMYEAALAADAYAQPEVPPQANVPTQPLRGGQQVTPPPQSRPEIVNNTDPRVVQHLLEAWMPETIATYKLRGFVQDVGGEVLESIPGRFRVRLGGKGSIYWVPNGPLSWFGIGNRNALIDVELLLERNPTQQSQLLIAVRMRSPYGGKLALSDSFKERCDQVFCDLRAYLMGQGVSVS